MRFIPIFMFALLGLSSTLKADVITCQFTEPFITTTYNMAKQTLKIVDEENQKPRIINKVSFQIKGPGIFELKDKNKNVLQILTLSNKGSDGMSNLIYPYEVVFAEIRNRANNGTGGCESNFLKRSESN